MSVGGYKIRNPAAIHFMTFVPISIGMEWIDVFTRKEYRDIVLDSIRYCQSEKGLALHSWCLMSNHLHLVVSAKNENLSDILRDFKKFTSKQIIEAIINNKQESRKDCLPAGRQGCCKSLKSKGVKTVVIQHINSGVRITNLRNSTVRSLFFKR